MSQYSPICWRCRGVNDSGVGTNCIDCRIDCRDEGTEALALAMGILFIALLIIGGSAYIFSLFA